MPKRNAEDRAAVPAELLAEPRVARERKSVEKYDVTAADAAAKQSKAAAVPRVKKPSARELKVADAEERLVKGSAMERCTAILDRMALRQDAPWFQEPVPAGEGGISDYLDVIRKPCDYSTVRSRMADGAYGDDPVAFAADMRLIYTNALRYDGDAEPRPSLL